MNERSVVIATSFFLFGIVLGRILERMEQEKPKPKKREPDTCIHCKHLYYNNDGSTGCDSPYEHVCLKGEVRMFKEFEQPSDVR